MRLRVFTTCSKRLRVSLPTTLDTKYDVLRGCDAKLILLRSSFKSLISLALAVDLLVGVTGIVRTRAPCLAQRTMTESHAVRTCVFDDPDECFYQNLSSDGIS